ncbi:MAG: hypothetical protein J2P45_02530 [Candidatus Dormibacteraeota bacterium]|nr:hypothetical protein [Candidatus Dormibacteraeota bacterium]
MDAGRVPTVGPRQATGRRLQAGLLLALTVLLAACSGPTLPRISLPRISNPLAGAAPGGSAGRYGSVQAFVPQAERFIEAHRGLKFKRPVKVQYLDDQAFNRRIVQIQRKDQSDTERQAKVLRALDLVPAGLDVEHAEESLLSGQVIGYYDPETKELAVRGTTASPAVRHVVVHELTHALQDQWFDLAAHQKNLGDDASEAYSALVEGDAVRIEREYVSTLSAADQRQIASGDVGGPPPSNTPAALIAQLEFPYAVGPRLVQAILAARGQAGLNQAFLNPPTNTSQAIHPDRYLAGQAAVQVADPSPDGAAFDHGTVGELGLDLMLGDLVQSGSLSSDQVSTALQAWTGDRYVAWTSGSQSCVRARFAASGPAGSRAMVADLQKWVSSHSGATLQTGDQPVLTRCG